MIELTVTSHHGAPAVPAPSASFDATGGTIGRAPSNTLVLDDPDRTVSRLHAQISQRDGQWFIVDRGSNPLSHNGRVLGAGNEARLADGDVLTIGSFELRVRELAGAAPATAQQPATAALGPDDSDDPFAHLLEGLGAPPGPPAVPASGPATLDPAARSLPDPLGRPASRAAADDPFADLLAPGTPASTPVGAAPALPPDDFSDLAGPGAGGRAESIDALFGLGSALSNDPLAQSPLADPVAQPNTAAAQDPLAAFGSQLPLQPPARSDHLPIESFGYVPPPAAPAVSAPPTPERAPEPDPLAIPPVDLSALAQSAPPVAASPPPAPVRAAPTGHAEPADTPAAGDDVLLAALLRGLGPLQQPIEALTPGLLERIGAMLRSATEGTLQLLHTRQEFKREVRAQVTMIAAQANNPLKFSPTVEVALAHLLGPGVRGFMPAEVAMRDAYQDLRAHEFGVMVGIRAALEHVIHQFEPDALEQNIATRSRLDAIFSANRKARLWDQFVKLYAEIARDAEDDFHSLFGKAFLQAYEEQMAKFKAMDGH
ncbi:MAG TPA: type VI secretion system-associated FHA domain protein TagH [Ottowia sp.]|uniref:type VI secretion system-associated FHA domain protein TagH n=1 Tax=Ottowia sp. TaxID=1898956 RepID=UPI002B999240|nr:type VI secretion system-associated FHA domain protein TagH [Ottowia sp.]HMN20141.1 type VI secretion system-associated FHA domain protein TagH [Ottowia sp.]